MSQDTGSEKFEGKRKASGDGNEGWNHEFTPIPCNQRFYRKAEYKQLSQGNKVYLRQLADERVGAKAFKASKKQKKGGKNGNDLQRSIAVLASAVDKLEVDQTLSKEQKEDDTDVTSNSTNSALSRIQNHRKK